MNGIDNAKLIYARQKALQTALGMNIPSVVNMYNSATAAIVEIGEMLQEDTRWKKEVTGSTREPRYNIDNFKEEFADVAIYLTNVLIYAGISVDEIMEVIDKKITKNCKRLLGDNYD